MAAVETTALLRNMRQIGIAGMGTPIMVMAMLSMMVLPLPALALDVLFTFNIALSLVVLLVTVYALRPLDFAVFPTVLLVGTLLRLALNIASTRVVLLHGHTGGAAAGHVIQAFGEFVVGGNYAVGLIVFTILIIINFVVVTKGATRVAEVTARFTLDAMPGKQMAIDADLNAGLVSQEQALERRELISQEADFYGAMDGSSKFVRGDAIAGILILLINIIGGLLVGTLQHGLDLDAAARVYTLLTIGDGLVAQIPALLLSTATAIIVTRVSRSQDMGTQVISQVVTNDRALAVAAGIIGALGLIPGMPNAVFLLLGAGMASGAWWLKRKAAKSAREVSSSQLSDQRKAAEKPKELTWDDVGALDAVGLEVGYRLIPLVDREQGGQLMPRIKGVRKKLSQELGFLISPVHIRDNLDMKPAAYRVTLKGVTVAEADVQPDRELAINPGKVYGELKGIPTRDPSFGLDAVWITPGQREQAQALGYTVVDASTVIATHLSQILQQYAHELLGFEEAQQLLDNLAKRSPKLVEDLVPKTVSLASFAKVLSGLLEEGIPIRDMRTVTEAVARQAAVDAKPEELLAAVRQAIGRSIVQTIVGPGEDLPLMTVDPSLEKILHQALAASGNTRMGLEPALAEQLQRSVAETSNRQQAAGRPSVLVTSPELRPWLAKMLRPSVKDLHVLAYTEIPDNRRISVVGTVGRSQEEKTE